MDSSKKISLKTFSVPSAKKNEDGVFPQPGKETDNVKWKQGSNDKDKKADKIKPKLSRTIKGEGKTARKSYVASKATPRSLTNEEYEAIFKVVIEADDLTKEVHDIYMVPTQLDSQATRAPEISKWKSSNTESAVKEKHHVTHKKDSDSGSPDKETLSENDSIADCDDEEQIEKADNGDGLSKTKYRAVQKKTLCDLTNTKISRDDGSPATVHKGKNLNEKDMGKEENVRKRKHKANKQMHNKRQKSTENDVSGKDYPWEKRDSKRNEETTGKQKKAKARVKKAHVEGSLTSASKEKKDAKEDAIYKTQDKDKANDYSEDISDREKKNGKKKVIHSRGTDNGMVTKKQLKNDMSKETGEHNTSQENTDCKEIKTVGPASEKGKTKKVESEGKEEKGIRCKERKKDMSKERKESKAMEETLGKRENCCKEQQFHLESVVKGTCGIFSQKVDDNTESEKEKTVEEDDKSKHRHEEKEEQEKVESKVEKKDSAEIKEEQKDKTKCRKRKKDSTERKAKKKNKVEHIQRNKDEVNSKEEKRGEEKDKTDNTDNEIEKKTEAECKKVKKYNIVPQDEEKSETGYEEREKGKLTSTDGENDDVESVLSEQSFGSSLLEMAQAVDQWDRPQEMQGRNERTPCTSEAERTTKKDSPVMIHKAKKKKCRKNQLHPRKLCFDREVLKKKRRCEEKCDSDSASSVPAELGTWVQCDAKECQKWRYLPDVLDPVQLPQRWVCSMNKDVNYNSCDKAEQDYDDSDHIFTPYTLGSIVWVKMDGFPWWPAIVDVDPDSDTYCQIPHEDSMVPTDYHVVFLDEKVTRTWIRKTRIQHLTVDQLKPGSIFLRGHKYKKEIIVAMKRAEIALHKPIQDRLTHFGFATCYKNLNTRWTKDIVKTKQPQKRKASKSVDNYDATSGPTSCKKIRVYRQLFDNSSDSNTHSPNTGYSPDSDFSSQSSSPDDNDDDSDNRETTKKKMVVRQKRKAKCSVSEARKMLKETSVSGKRIAKKYQNRLKLKKGNVRNISVKTKGQTQKRSRLERQDSTDIESDATVSSEKGEHKFVKTAKPQKKKLKFPKRQDNESPVQENDQKRNPLSETKKTENKNDCVIQGLKNKMPTGKENTDKPPQSSGQGKKAKITKRTEFIPTEANQAFKKKKLFKSEMARKRDKALQLQQDAKPVMPERIQDKTMKTKPQKFVAPTKLMSEKSTSKSAPLLQSDISPMNNENLDNKPENKSIDRNVTVAGEYQVSAQTGTSEDCHIVDAVKDDLVTVSSKHCIHSPVSRQSPNISFDTHGSPPLSPQCKDQFVPSMEDSDDKEDDNENIPFLEKTVPTDKKWKSKAVTQSKESVQTVRRDMEGDSDSECLDLEEDFPIPGLQQVMQVQTKGLSDQEAMMSDPLEMAED